MQESSGNPTGDDNEFRSSSRTEGTEGTEGARTITPERFSDSENLSQSLLEEMPDVAGQERNGETAFKVEDSEKHPLVAWDLSEVSSDNDGDTVDSVSVRKRQKKTKKARVETEGPILSSKEECEVDVTGALDAWKANEEGRELMNHVFPISVDELFNQIFSGSEFFMKYHASRKTFGKMVEYPSRKYLTHCKVIFPFQTLSLENGRASQTAETR